MSRASERYILLIQHCYSQFGTTQFKKTVRNRHNGPVWVSKYTFGGPVGPPRAPGCHIWSQLPPFGQTHDNHTVWPCSDSLRDLYSTPGLPKGLVWGAPVVLMGPEGPDLVPTADDWLVWVELMVTGGPNIDDIYKTIIILLHRNAWYFIVMRYIA